MKKLLLILLCLPLLSLGQACEYGNSTDASEICDFVRVRGNSFASDKNAQDALKMILDATKSKQKFAIKECTNISNAIATTYKGINYILYDKDFIDEITTKTNSWAKLSILAHEIGHHIYGHTLKDVPSLETSRQWELEADEYSGFVMYQLGVNLSQAQEAILIYASDGDDTYSTHPSKEKRLKAIERGWNKSKDSKYDYSTQDSNMTAEDYFYKGYNSNDYQVSLDNYTKCIRISPNFKNAYMQRGLNYAIVEKYEDGIEDLNKAIFLDSYDSRIYLFRGTMYYSLGKYKQALADYNKAISIDQNNGDIYVWKGIVYSKLGNSNEAIFDFKKAIALGVSTSQVFAELGNEYYNQEKYKKAKKYFNKAISIDNKESDSFVKRGQVYIKLGDYNKAKQDFSKAIILDPDYTNAYMQRAYLYGLLKNFQEAISDYTRIIKLLQNDLDSDYSLNQAYFLRGVAKEFGGYPYCLDYKKACDLGGEQSCERLYQLCR